MKAIQRYTGFSQFESLLGLAIMALVVVVVLPAMKSHLRAEQRSRAEIQAREVARVVLDYNADTGRWPHVHNGQADLSVLTGNGQNPERHLAEAGLVGSMIMGTGPAQSCVSGMKPWLEEEPLDPWRRPFRVYLVEEQKSGPDGLATRGVLVVSDGRNGKLETDPARWEVPEGDGDRDPAPVMSGDDIGFYLRKPDWTGMP